MYVDIQIKYNFDGIERYINYIHPLYMLSQRTAMARLSKCHCGGSHLGAAPLIKACDPISPHVPLLVAHGSEHRAFLLPHAGLAQDTDTGVSKGRRNPQRRAPIFLT